MKKVPSRSRAGVHAGPANGGQAMFSLLHAAHAIEKRLEDALEKVGLSNAKFGALMHLAEAGEPLSLSECAARMTCVRSNITQLIDRLEADGLVRRVDDPADRRGVKAMLTPLGIERQAAGAKHVDQVQKEVARTLAGVDPTTLARALAALK
jgi:DNA-binding MarR family transcriptional regulator